MTRRDWASVVVGVCFGGFGLLALLLTLGELGQALRTGVPGIIFGTIGFHFYAQGWKGNRELYPMNLALFGLASFGLILANSQINHNFLFIQAALCLAYCVYHGGLMFIEAVVHSIAPVGEQKEEQGRVAT